jgi:hypothetical protein
MTIVKVEELARDFEIEIAGKAFVFVRSLETLKTVEDAVGPAYAFGQKIDRRGAQLGELVRLYSALVRKAPQPPTTRQIEEWVFETGTHHVRLAIWLCTLTLGAKELEAVLAARQTGTEREDANAPRPFAPTDAPSGATSLDWHNLLAGLRPNSGDAPTMN